MSFSRQHGLAIIAGLKDRSGQVGKHFFSSLQTNIENLGGRVESRFTISLASGWRALWYHGTFEFDVVHRCISV